MVLYTWWQPVFCMAFKQLLLGKLQAALGFYYSDSSLLEKQRDRHIPLYRAKDDNQVLYVSGIALRLSRASNIPALEIATVVSSQLVRQVESSSGVPALDAGSYNRTADDFTVQVIPPGWIHLHIREPAIASWLQRLACMPPEPSNYLTSPPPLGNTSRLFAVQYAHARCCSLVRLADRDGTLTLEPIPWLNSKEQLRFCHPTERALIAALVEVLDDLYCPSPSRQMINWEKAALNLSQAFQNFYSCCRIWGEVKIENIHLAQARLGLVMATRSVLRLLLQNLFGICTPLEL